MEKKRFSSFAMFLVVMALLAVLGVGLMIFGAMTHASIPKASPWTVARCMQHG